MAITISWDGGQSLRSSVSGSSVTITLTGRATIDFGVQGITVEAAYHVYEGSTDLGSMSNKSITLSNVSVGAHTYVVKGYFYHSGNPMTTAYGNPSVNATIVAPNGVKWNGTPSFTATYIGNGVVRFTLTGSATSTLSGVTFESSYEILTGSTNIKYFSASNKTVDVECPPGTRTYTCRAYMSSGGINYFSTNNPSASVTITSPTLSWSSGSNLTYEASGQNLVMHINGNITLGGGYSGRTIYYILYYGSTVKSQDGTSKDITVTNGATLAEGQWSLYAYVNTSGTITYSAPLTVTVSWSDCVAYYNGSRWIQCIAHYYNGSRWVECKPYYYNGSRWVELAYKP